jgi:outer membrane protein assembly factor BamB
MPSSQLGTGYWQWRPAGGTFGGADAYLGGLAYNYVHDGRDFYSLNASIGDIYGPRNSRSNQTASILQIREGEYMIIGTSGVNDEQGIAQGFLKAISLAPGNEGKTLWSGTFTPPSGADAETVSFTGVYPDEKMFLFFKTKTQERFGYSLDNFQQVWVSEPESQFGYYGTSTNYYNGTLLSYGYGAVLYCRDIKTGQLLWQYDPTSIGTESAYGGNYPIGVVIVGDGKLYTVTGEHSPTQPLMRGPNLRCIDAATGKEVWKILGFFGGMSPTSSNILMADGILVGLNHFDNQLYAFGRGPSATTVITQNDVSVLGNKVMIKGTVTDQSPSGKRNTNNIIDFSLKGTPAISDANMEAWMEYLFMQQAKPTNAYGVDVSLSALDPNGNLVPIGTTTSDINGNYAIAYNPEVPGTYQIIANFAGTKAYGPSSATTYMTVEDAPATTSTPTPLPESIADAYFVPAIAGIIIAIAVVGVILALLLLRKRP